MMTARPYDAVLCDIEGVIRHAAICGSADRAHAAVTDWSNLVPHADHDVLSLLTQARTVVPVASVSNATTPGNGPRRQGLDDLADDVVNTPRIRLMKPDARAYVKAAAQPGAPIHHCLFIDDTGANVTAAREVGITALHYRQIEDLRSALAPLLNTAPDAQHT